jgi:hypothetical protein
MHLVHCTSFGSHEHSSIDKGHCMKYAGLEFEFWYSHLFTLKSEFLTTRLLDKINKLYFFHFKMSIVLVELFQNEYDSQFSILSFSNCPIIITIYTLFSKK